VESDHISVITTPSSSGVELPVFPKPRDRDVFSSSSQYTPSSYNMMSPSNSAADPWGSKNRACETSLESALHGYITHKTHKTKQNAEDENLLFLKSLLPTLRELPAEIREELKMDFYSKVMRASFQQRTASAQKITVVTTPAATIYDQQQSQYNEGFVSQLQDSGQPTVLVQVTAPDGTLSFQRLQMMNNPST
jgi:hypothetical protein